MSEKARSATLLEMKRLETARENIESFSERFKKPHLYLAYHAAFPLVLTSDLLYQLWANFQCDIDNQKLNIPWIAVADLLLSGLCKEVGYELYEMDADVRTVLLNDLKAQSNLGQQRIDELSDFLLEYVRQQLNSPDPYLRDFAQAQRWRALSYTKTGKTKVAHELAEILSKLSSSYDDNRAELVRMASLLETIAEPLAEFTPLLKYAQGMADMAHDDVKSAVAQLSDVAGQQSYVEVLGVRLPIPNQVLRKIKKVQAPQTDFFISYHNADHSWAEWIAWQLEEAGYSIVRQAWNFQPGASFTSELDNITKKIAKSIVVVLSPDYVETVAAMPDWTAAFAQDPRGMEEQHILIAVQVRDCISELEDLLGEIAYTDLVGLDEREASQRLISSMWSIKPTTASTSPVDRQRSVSKEPSFPGVLPPTPKPTSDIEIFYSYAHKDEYWRNRLATHLSALQRQGLIKPWHDRNINAGTPWASTIDEHLNRADIILLLISPDFIASDYCSSLEAKRALERHQAGEARVIPVILHPVAWKGVPFEHLQALPTDGRAITLWPNRNQALLNVAQGIQRVIEELHAQRASHQPPAPTTSRTPAAPLWNIPYRRNPFFTGREELLKQLHANLTRSKAAALTQAQAISGLGGIGKTQTAVEYAYRHGEEYHAVLWMNAATRDALVSSCLELAALLSLPEREEQDQNIIVAAVKHWFATHDHWLLIFDNADELALVDEFLPQRGQGHLLLTTRASAPGSLAHSIAVEKMDLEESMLLLLRRARVLAPEETLEQALTGDRAAAEALAYEMDGLPLALDQAGAYIEETHCRVEDYLRLYQRQRTALLARRGGLVSDHPDSVATTWSLSFQKVEQTNPAVTDLLRCCAFLDADAIPEEMITEGASQLGLPLEALATDQFKLDEAIALLQRFSLMRRDLTEKTLSINRLVQAVLKDAMNAKTQQMWAERVVRAVNAAFPEVQFATWQRCQRYLPHALACAALIEQYRLAFPESARLLDRTAWYLEEHAQYAQAETLYQHALAIYEKALPPDHPDTAVTLNNLGLLYRDQGRYGEAEPVYQRALRIKEKALGPDHPDTGITLNNLAQLYQDQGRYEEAESLYQRALRIKEKALPPDHPDIAVTLDNLAQLYQDQGRYQEAEPLYQRALAIKEQALGPDHPSTAITLDNLATFHQAQGRYKEAKPLYQRALAIKEKALLPDHPDTAVTLNNLAQLYHDQGRDEEAEPLYQRALRIREKALGPEHPDVATILNNLAALYTDQGKYEQAEQLLQRALAIKEKALGPDHPDTATTLDHLAQLYHDQGRYEEAEPLYRRSLAIKEKVRGPDHPSPGITLNNLAQLYHDQGRYAEAEPLYQRALAIYEEALGPRHPSIATVLENYANLLRRTEREDEATKLEERARAI